MTDDLVGEGAARELLSALHNLHALLRSPRVGPKAVEPLLPEIRRRVTGLARGSIRAVSAYDTAVLPGAIAAWETRLVEALDAAARHHVDARTRLALEAAVADIAPKIDALREALDIRARERSPGFPLDLLLGSLVLETLGSPASRRPFGDALKVRNLPEDQGNFAVLAAPQLTLSLLAFTLSFAARGTETIALQAECSDGRVRLTARPTSQPSTHVFVAPRATDAAATLLFGPDGLLSRTGDGAGAVWFSLLRGQGDFGVPSAP